MHSPALLLARQSLTIPVTRLSVGPMPRSIRVLTDLRARLSRLSTQRISPGEIFSHSARISARLGCPRWPMSREKRSKLWADAPLEDANASATVKITLSRRIRAPAPQGVSHGGLHGMRQSRCKFPHWNDGPLLYYPSGGGTPARIRASRGGHIVRTGLNCKLGAGKRTARY